MELAKYKACICEGSAEAAIIDVLVDSERLIFTREEILRFSNNSCKSSNNDRWKTGKRLLKTENTCEVQKWLRNKIII